MKRKAAVAGAFYPKQCSEVEKMFADAFYQPLPAKCQNDRNRLRQS